MNRVKSYVMTMSYPASRDDLVNGAVDLGADVGVIQSLQYLPRGLYRSWMEVTEALDEIE